MSEAELTEGRYLLFLDILGFSEITKTKRSAEILKIISKAFEEFDRWGKLNGSFQTIYFSDTFLFYQTTTGYHKSYFLDIYAIGAFVLTALMAEGIAARGAIAFGGFEVWDTSDGKHQAYFGTALVDAHEAERKEGWIGITILPSAWEPFELNDSGIVDCFANEGVWIKREDKVLLLNPFLKLRGWYIDDQVEKIPVPYLKWDAPEFPNEIRAFHFLKETSESFAEKGDFTGKVASKYHNTMTFLRHVFGEELYAWACKLADEAGDVEGTAGVEDN